MDFLGESSGQSPEAHGVEGEVQGRRPPPPMVWGDSQKHSRAGGREGRRLGRHCDVKPAGTSVTAGQGHEAGEKTKRADEQGAAGKVPCSCANSAAVAAMEDDEEWLLEREEPEGEAAQDEAQGSGPAPMEPFPLYRTFNELGLQEVERIFLRAQYPELLAREDLQKRPNATGAECQKHEKQ
ncbi:uncharacterized protein RHO17_003881 [Thomomys bottae]